MSQQTSNPVGLVDASYIYITGLKKLLMENLADKKNATTDWIPHPTHFFWSRKVQSKYLDCNSSITLTLTNFHLDLQFLISEYINFELKKLSVRGLHKSAALKYFNSSINSSRKIQNWFQFRFFQKASFLSCLIISCF